MDWIDPAQDGDQWRVLVNTAMNLRVPSCTIGDFSTRAQLHEVSYVYKIPAVNHALFLVVCDP
jgi:hypothetical protein